ncbi:sensor histidine kinase/response regulator [Rhodotorula toruloides]|uniref:histidine kinase n=1 Tax=Rhodotorula toruloides TaxID=5286 RepID=A0A511K9H2_RHOTO|nr:sensor histidine kinase/response regulator [Rhodotorula toruloides]
MAAAAHPLTSLPREHAALPLDRVPTPRLAQAGPSTTPPASALVDNDILHAWRCWWMEYSLGHFEETATLPAALQQLLDNPATESKAGEPSYACNYSGGPETAEQALEFYARHKYIPPPYSPDERKRVQLVRKFDLDGLTPLIAVSELCELVRSFFGPDITVLATSLTASRTCLIGISQSPQDTLDWQASLEEIESTWCMCRHGIFAGEDDAFVVLDTARDWRVGNIPLYSESGKLHFYAGVRISLPSDALDDGQSGASRPIPIGTLCAVSHQAQAEVTQPQLTALKTLARRIEREILVANEARLRRRGQQQAAFVSEFLQLTLGGSATPSKASPGMEAVLSANPNAPPSPSSPTSAAFIHAAQRLCDLTGVTSAAIVDTRSSTASPQNSAGWCSDSCGGARRPRIVYRTETPEGSTYEIEEGVAPLAILGQAGVPEEQLEKAETLSKEDLRAFDDFVRRLRVGEHGADTLPDKILSHLVVGKAESTRLIPIFDHNQALALLIFVSLPDPLLELGDGDRTFAKNIGWVCLSALIRDQSSESDRTKLAFVSSISHALRLPLHGLAGQLELMRGAGAGVEVADVCMDSLRSLLDDSVDFYNLNDQPTTQATSSSSSEITDLAELLQDVTARSLTRAVQFAQQEWEDSICTKDVRVVVDIAARQNGWLVRTSPSDLRRIFGNVIENAWSYTDAGQVTVSLQLADGTSMSRPGEQLVKVRILDTGCGMSEAFLRSGKLFQPFRRADAYVPGIGLGLPLASLLVAQHGGQIHVTSVPAKGTTVDILLPILFVASQPAPAIRRTLSDEIMTASKAFSSPSSPKSDCPSCRSSRSLNPPSSRLTTPNESPVGHDEPAKQHDSSKHGPIKFGEAAVPATRNRLLRVLGCEDNAIARNLLAALVKQKGYEFRAAADGQQGVSIFRDDLYRPDVTVMDIGMPIMDGLHAATVMREIEQANGWPRHRIIALTGLSNEQDRVKAMSNGGPIDEWLLKGGDSLRVLTSEFARMQAQINVADATTCTCPSTVVPPLPQPLSV